MTTVARALLHCLFDDASLFPPSAAPLEAVLGLHAASGSSPWGLARGRLLLPLGAVDRLADERRLLGRTEPLDLGIVVGSPADPTAGSPLPALADTVGRLRGRDPGIRTRHVEYRTGDQSPAGLRTAGEDVRGLADELGLDRAFLEVAASDRAGMGALVDVVGDLHDQDPRVCAKLRFGGTTAELRPADDVVLHFLARTIARDLPFKGTAGLHHAWYAPDAHHGYLAVALAVHTLQVGGTERAAMDALRRRDAGGIEIDASGELVAADLRIDVAAAARIRAAFLSFGTCSFTEPLAAFLALPGAPERP